MKSASTIYDQKERLFRVAMRLASNAARRAHPETDGNENLVHNWGNEAARAVWEAAWKRVRRFDAAFERMYSEAEHRDEHGPRFRPLWCPMCQAA